MRDFFVAYKTGFGYNRVDMKLESDGILIGMDPIGERDSIAMVFSREFGMLHGIMRAAQIARKNRPLVGQVGAVSWNARLESQLGTFHWESNENLSARLMSDMHTLGCMNASFALIGTLLPEREPFANLYDATLSFLRTMSPNNPMDDYLQWEIKFLQELGYALDLSHCSGCDCRENLNYLSPKTGRAVCDKCAKGFVGDSFHGHHGMHL